MSKNDQQGVSRRQFLNYTLMGVGGFLVAGTVAPMLRFAIDPALKAAEDQDMVAVGDLSEFGPEPVRKDFQLAVKDGWYDAVLSLSAWITVSESGEILALSPICTHLGCTIQWGSDLAPPEHYYCPCHGGVFTKDGINVEGTPPDRPLNVYRHEVRDGVLYLGQAVPREEL